ncbi:hypothetical protein KCU92_g150, partial [Aureobasidium melanogenum]
MDIALINHHFLSLWQHWGLYLNLWQHLGGRNCYWQRTGQPDQGCWQRVGRPFGRPLHGLTAHSHTVRPPNQDEHMNDIRLRSIRYASWPWRP